MRLPIELIHELVQEVAGEETIKLVDYLKDKHNVSEFKVADKLEITVNQVRNLLYRLDEYNLVYFMRKKDKEKGWYEYYWTLDLVKMRTLIIDRKQEQMKKIRQELKTEQGQQYYYAPSNPNLRINAEEALEVGFRSPEYDEVLQPEDMEKRKKALNALLVKLREDVKIAIATVEVRKDTEPKKKAPVKKTAAKKKVVKKKVTKKKPVKKKVVKKKSVKKVAKKKATPKKKLIKKKVVKKPIKKKPKSLSKKKIAPKKKVVTKKKQVQKKKSAPKKKLVKKKVPAKKSTPKKAPVKKTPTRPQTKKGFLKNVKTKLFHK